MLLWRMRVSNYRVIAEQIWEQIWELVLVDL